ncbi:MAG: hypothetical protein EBX36_12860, partial [Planctomycetia bacterium]|nr:hypothetical protein [Planctomycetia bacterium]
MRLRQASAARTRLEEEITSEHEAETVAARRDAAAAIAAIEKAYSREAEATRTQHAAEIDKANTEAAARRDDYEKKQKADAATIRRTWEKQDAQIKGDAQFEENQAREVFKEKRKQPTALLKRTEKQLADLAAQLDDVGGRSLKFLVDR